MHLYQPIIQNGFIYMNYIQAGFVLFMGYFASCFVSSLVSKGLFRLTYIKQKKLIARTSFYIIFSLFFVSALSQLGINLQFLLGAAGILTIAIGFAAQTSASNFISGLFLIFEGVISEGDLITADGITGEVLSIDLLSTSLKTVDNIFVRIPNEQLIKSKFENLSRFSTRQLEIPILFSYETNVDQIRTLWFSIVNENPLCLKSPVPALTIKSILKENIAVGCTVWVDSQNYAALKNDLQSKILQVFEAEKIRPYRLAVHNVNGYERLPSE